MWFKDILTFFSMEPPTDELGLFFADWCATHLVGIIDAKVRAIRTDWITKCGADKAGVTPWRMSGHLDRC